MVMKAFFKKKKIIILAATVVVIAAAAVGGFTIKNKMAAKTQNADKQVRFTTLHKTNLTKTISSSGAIKSGTSTSVYSNLEYNVKQVNVEVGDSVKAGDIVAVIDTSTLEDDIAKLEQTIAASETKSALEIENKKNSYDNAVYIYENNLNNEIINGEANVKSSQSEMEEKKRAYEYKKVMLENDEVSQEEVTQAETAYNNAVTNYEKAQASLEASKINVQQNIQTAKNAYESAVANSNNASDKLQLENKKKDLAKGVVTAPVDGIVTTVNATVGSKCESAICVIQDLTDLIVDVDVDETEISNVEVGQNVQVTVDASEGEVIQGQVVSVDPISTASAQASTSSSSGSSKSGGASSAASSSNSTSSDVTFTVKVQLTGQSEAVKVGMNAVVNIILDEAHDVYAVPYESIMSTRDGSKVYAAEESDSGYVVKEIPVSVGLESDAFSEIQSDDIEDGMIILNEPSSYQPGSSVEIKRK